jgi:hypothetical protein
MVPAELAGYSTTEKKVNERLEARQGSIGVDRVYFSSYGSLDCESPL